MSMEYQKFCDRLKEERMRLSLSQMEIGHLLRMSQSNYSKVELGKRYLSYYEIQYLCATDIDVYYVFTGERGHQVEADDFFGNITVEETKRDLELLCVLYAFLYKTKKLTSSLDDHKKIENLRFALMPGEKGKTIFYKLRRALNYNQGQMTKLMNMDPKKLRNLKNGKILPDSQVMCQMMDLFSIPYALFLNDKKGLISEINCLLKNMDESKRKEVLDGMKHIQKTFN